MANTFSQIYIHVVFAVQNRKALINPLWEEELFKYISGIVRNKDQKILAINGTSNHLHLLISIKPNCCLSDLVREIKKSSNQFIKSMKISRFDFRWQEGFGAFSCSQSNLNTIVSYIQNQKEHHSRQSFSDEYIENLRAFKIEFNKDYLFDRIE